MKCWIKRYGINEEGKKEFKGYFSKQLWENKNHWVKLRKEAKKFFDGRKARGIISKYNLKDCEIEYE